MANLDPDIEMFLAPSKGRPFTKSDVRVNLSDKYNRKPLPDEDESYLNQVWADRLHDNPHLWDGSKFRIDSSNMADGVAILNLGITGYRDFQCTNFSPRVGEFKEMGIKDHNDPHAHLADPLGVGALVQTSDDYFILMRRSKFCGEAVGKLDIPGGHPEPGELVGKIAAPDIDIASLDPTEVVHEIFDSIHREICDEVNLQKDDVTFPVLLGIVRNTPSAGRPTAEFYSRCSLSSAEIKSLYEKGTQADAEETTNIVFIPMSAISNMESSEDYADIWNQMTANAKGAVTLIRMTSLVNKFIKAKID